MIESLGRLGLGARLTLFNLLLFAPFMGFRVLRTAGDDKVYVAQALEMARDGHWFVQTLADVPDYYKGPLHLALVRIGMLFFGTTMWATLWMNLALLIVGSIALGKAMERMYPAAAEPSRKRDWATWVGGAFACSIGVYLHAYASQMEVELACMFSIALYCLSRADEKRFEYAFWILTGVSGWFKSPLHSVLIGLGGLLYWIGTGEILARIKRGRTWAALGVGTVVGFLGFLPAYFLDGENFTRAYLLRETFHKGDSGEPWYSPVWPILTFFLFPWMLVAFVAYADGITRIYREAREKRLGAGGRKLVLLGFAFLLPSMLFFAWFRYRAQNYTLPSAGAWLLAIGAIWASAGARWAKAYRAAVVAQGLALLGFGAGFAVLGSHYEKFPPAWPSWLIPFLVLGGLSTGALWVVAGLRKSFSAAFLLLALLPFYLSFGALYAVLGEREMLDLKTYIAEKPSCAGQPLKVGYYNVQKKLWSEWGYLNFMVKYPIQGLHTEEALQRAVADGALILVAEKENLEGTIARAAVAHPELEPVTQVWHRWRTQGRAPDGSTLWTASWQQKDLRVLEAQYFMVRFKKRGEEAQPGCI